MTFLFVGFVRKQEALGGEVGISGIPTVAFGRPGLLALALLCTLLFVLLAVHIRRSWMGFAFGSVADDEDTARILGIDVPRFKLWAFVIGTAGAHRMKSPLATLLRTDRESEHAKARELLEFVGLGDAAGAMPAELPLGDLKRLEVARALALEPRLLLLDEPLAGLNQAEARAMADLLASLTTDRRGVVLIEHNIREVARICPRICVQDNGRRLVDGPAGQVMASAELRRAYLGGEAA